MTGRLIRQARAQDAAVCADCQHPTRLHRERPAELYALRKGTVEARPNPDYEPLVFHCAVPGCGCQMRRG